MPLNGGSLTLTTSYVQLNATVEYYVQLTIRVEDDAAGNVSISTDGTNEHFYLKTDESLTFGPNTGTIATTDLYLKGTADDVVSYIGVEIEKGPSS